MTLRKSEEGCILTVAPQGRLDSATSGDFESFLQESFTKEFEELVLDFAEVDFISSKGLRVLVSQYKNLQGRKMKIINANATVVEVLRLSGLLKYFAVE